MVNVEIKCESVDFNFDQILKLYRSFFLRKEFWEVEYIKRKIFLDNKKDYLDIIGKAERFREIIKDYVMKLDCSDELLCSYVESLVLCHKGDCLFGEKEDLANRCYKYLKDNNKDFETLVLDLVAHSKKYRFIILDMLLPFVKNKEFDFVLLNEFDSVTKACDAMEAEDKKKIMRESKNRVKRIGLELKSFREINEEYVRNIAWVKRPRPFVMNDGKFSEKSILFAKYQITESDAEGVDSNNLCVLIKDVFENQFDIQLAMDELGVLLRICHFNSIKKRLDQLKSKILDRAIQIYCGRDKECNQLDSDTLYLCVGREGDFSLESNFDSDAHNNLESIIFEIIAADEFRSEVKEIRSLQIQVDIDKEDELDSKIKQVVNRGLYRCNGGLPGASRRALALCWWDLKEICKKKPREIDPILKEKIIKLYLFPEDDIPYLIADLEKKLCSGTSKCIKHCKVFSLK